MKVAIIGNHPVVRLTTDEGIDGIGAAELAKPYLKPMIEFYRDMIIGKDPTDVERVMLGIRRMGSFKPWGAAVSAIELLPIPRTLYGPCPVADSRTTVSSRGMSAIVGTL